MARLLFPILIFVNTFMFFIMAMLPFFSHKPSIYQLIDKTTFYLMSGQFFATLLCILTLSLRKQQLITSAWLIALVAILADSFFPFFIKHQWLLNIWCVYLTLLLIASMKMLPYAVSSKLMIAMLFYAFALILFWLKGHQYNLFPHIVLNQTFAKLYFAFNRYLEMCASTTFFISFFILYQRKTA